MISYKNEKLKMEGKGFVCSYEQIKEKTHLGGQTLHRLQYFSEVLKIKWDKVYCFEIQQSGHKRAHSVIIVGKLKEHTIEYFRREYYSPGAGSTMCYLDGSNKVKATIVENVCNTILQSKDNYFNFQYREKQDSNGDTVTFKLMGIILKALKSNIGELAINLMDRNEELAKYLIKEEVI